MRRRRHSRRFLVARGEGARAHCGYYTAAGLQLGPVIAVRVAARRDAQHVVHVFRPRIKDGVCAADARILCGMRLLPEPPDPVDFRVVHLTAFVMCSVCFWDARDRRALVKQGDMVQSDLAPRPIHQVGVCRHLSDADMHIGGRIGGGCA
jgi:hypothetical protein